MNTQTKNFRMVDISANIPKSVKNEVIEARERVGVFEKNNALKRALKHSAPPKMSYIQTFLYWCVGLTIIGVILWGTIAGHGGY